MDNLTIAGKTISKKKAVLAAILLIILAIIAIKGMDIYCAIMLFANPQAYSAMCVAV
jgi:hypothetical protein